MVGRSTQVGYGQGGLRTRYFPKSRIGQGLVATAPWLDLALLAICFLFLNGNIVLQQGTIIDLPEASFFDGLRSGIRVVVLSVEDGSVPGVRTEIVFFNDERFNVSDSKRMIELQEQFARTSAIYPKRQMVLQADRHVQHGTLMNLLNMAQEVGIKEVNMATRTSTEGGALPNKAELERQ